MYLAEKNLYAQNLGTEWIVFYRDGDIYHMDSDGQCVQRLFRPFRASIRWIRWSPDGRSVVLVSVQDLNEFAQNAEISIVRLDTLEFQNISNHPAKDTHPAWSPEGKRIAFVSERGQKNNDDIFVVNTDGTNLQRLVSHPYTDSCPDWSRDGKQIVFASDRESVDILLRPPNREIFIMNADGSNLRRITHTPLVYETEPAWSPDGKEIAFVSASQDDPNWDIYVMNVDGTNVRRLTTAQQEDWQPRWSPDGTRIAFERILRGDRGSNREIFVMNADGTNQRNLTEDPAYDASPDWFDPGASTSVSPQGKVAVTWGELKR